LILIASHLGAEKIVADLVEIAFEQKRAGYIPDAAMTKLRGLYLALMTEMELALSPDNFMALKMAL